jgi:class 3 adenylate cyclase
MTSAGIGESQETRDAEKLGSKRLTKTALALQSAVSAADIDAFTAMGVIGPVDTAGLYDPGDVTRLRLVVALRESGIDLKRFAAAIASGSLSLDFAGTIVADAAGLTTTSIAECRAALGIDRDTFDRFMLALGLAAPADDEPIRADDLEMLRIYAAARGRGLPQETVFRVLRSFALGMRTIVDAQRELFRQSVEDPMLASGASYAAMFAQTAGVRLELQRLGYRLSALLLRRFLERAVFDNLISRFEDAIDAQGVRRHHGVGNHTLCFVDISGFTERTETRGDAAAAELGATLVEIVQEQATLHNGQLIKALGDGAMLHFSQPEDSVRSALHILQTARRRQLPLARAGIATGPTITQDGDYYGRVVNHAARLIGVAKPGEVLVTAEVAGAVHSPTLHFRDVGTFQLKGIGDAIRAFAAEAA